jgi:hypothetical protein
MGSSAEHCHWTVRDDSHAVGFEVKTTIPSLGELFRQLSLYGKRFSDCEQLHSWRGCQMCKMFVVCPDARFADKIREQGYGFIQSPGAMPTTNGQAKDDGWLFGLGS